MIAVVPAFWHKSKNFGDALTPYLIKKITGYDAMFSNQHDQPKYMVTGSILNAPEIESCIVWGAGTAWTDTHFKKPLQVHAVRGPLSRNLMLKFGHDCPEVYGDPGLLLPRFYKPVTPTYSKYKLGIIPHIVDYIDVHARYSTEEDILIINLFKPVEQVIDDILSCKILMSSSLHGLIAAHAYEKPCLWVKFSDQVIGDGTKFRDYLLSVGHQTYDPVVIPEDIKTQDLHRILIPEFEELNINLNNLWEVCPFKP